MENCNQFLIKVAQAIQQKKIPEDPSIISAMKYSGIQWNDQGDISQCLNDPTLNFVEIALRQGQGQVYRGLCLPSQCSAQWLNSNKEIVIEFAKNFNIPMILNKNQIKFTQYPPEDSNHFSNVYFILITLLFLIFFVLIIASYFISYSQTKNQQKKTSTYQSLQSQHSKKTFSQQSLKQPLNDDKEEKYDIENASKELIKKQNIKQSLIIQIIGCWNLKENIEKLITLNANNQELLGFNCIRVLSFLQVVFGHEFFIRVQYTSNYKDLPLVQAQTFSLFIFSCLYSVDVFFFLGGFFVSYVSADPKFLSLFSFKKQVRLISTFFAAIINRIFRILPSYSIALLIFWKYSYFFGNSPTWYEFIEFSQQCDQKWWKRLLFIDNLYENGLSCFGWGWYLSNDMQMFIFSLFLIIIYANNKKYGKITILVTFLAFQFVGIYLSFSNNYLIITSLSTMPKEEYYIKPWSRSPPYFIGLLFGIFYKEYVQEKSNEQKFSIISKIKSILQKSWSIKWGFYFIGLGIIFFLIFGPHPLQVNGPNYWNQGFQNFWYGTCRTFYVFGVILILLPGMCGSRDLVMQAMSSKIFQFISKLTFQGYLIHYVVLTYSQWNSNDSLYLNTQNILQLYSSELIITLFFSLIFVVLIEQPFTNLANLIFGRKKENKPQQKQEEQQKQEVQQGQEILKNRNSSIN